MEPYDPMVEAVQRRLWDASFARGPRAGDQPDASTWTRRLATRHLKAAATDGWNVVAGAVQLAQAWALLPDVVPTTLTRNYEYPLCIRLRLAVCLGVSWKFQRCNYSHFPRRFDADPPSLLGPHSHELAALAFLPAAYLCYRDRPEDVGEVIDGRREAAGGEGAAAAAGLSERWVRFFLPLFCPNLLYFFQRLA